MQFVADLHLHSKYSRAVSPQMTLPVMAEYARQKGLDVLTTGDWTHPLWFKEIREQLEEEGEGVYKLKFPISNFKFPINTNKREVLFLLSTEISSIFKQGDRLRRIHNLVFVPDFGAAEKVIKELQGRGCNLRSDGRPIIGLSSKNLLELVMGIDERAMLIPCHVWTPHFGLYGSASGFETITESFGELSKYIYGVETGLSSDPDMNWQIGELKNRSILSFSDAHSPAKMGREATVFVLKNKNGISNDKFQISNEKLNISYENIRRAIMRDPGGKLEIGYTVEFYPEEGKYHFSGHRNCKYAAGPEEINKNGNICPVCKRRVTEGVDLRVKQLADEGLRGRAVWKEIPPNPPLIKGGTPDIKGGNIDMKWYVDKLGIQPSYVKLVPLLEIVAEALYSTVASQKSKSVFADLCEKAGSEMDVLLKASISEIERIAGERVAEGVRKVREGDIVISPGYDGEYGVVRIWEREEKKSKIMRKTVVRGQMGLEI